MTTKKMNYAELHCRSNCTFLEGASHPEELAAAAAAAGIAAVALTDRGGLYGSVRFGKAAAACGIAAIVGAELQAPDGSDLVVLAENRHGYAALCEMVSHAQLRGSKNAPRTCWEDFDGRSGVVVLASSEAAIATLRERFGQEQLFVELQHHLHPNDARRCRDGVLLAQRYGLRTVATNGVWYAAGADARLGDVLACIKAGISLEQARERALLRPNAEYYLKTPAAMTRIFSAYPHAVEETMRIAQRCTFRLDRLDGQFPLFPVPDGSTPQRRLRELVYAGAARRYGMPLTSKVERQLEYELGMVARMDLAGYFLIVWDIVRAADELGVLCQGRGSAANSAVCYALGITAVDPIGMDLLFERFMSEGRKEIPDIDIDFAHQDREKVIQYVYQRYGREHAAMACEVVTYRLRSAIRDVGKAIGLTLAQVDTVAKTFDASESLEEAAQTAGSSGALLVETCRRIDGFPRHLGIHSGGMVMTRDPLVRVAPIEWATMDDRTVIQWDKDDLQELGLIKIDLLGLGMLSLLREAFALRERLRGGPPMALHTIPPDDPQTYAMIARADTIGVFQIESRAQQSMLPLMKPACFYDLVMQVAIIRPGPIQGEMIHPFLRRRAGLEPIVYPHDCLKPVLERTLGVPLFQEQGMRMAIEAAGFSPGEADELRRAMGHKRSHERMRVLQPKLLNGMVANGIDREAAERLFHMLEGFADYGFPESHAASFALLAYASAYVKSHEPAVFAAAILNVQPMGFYSPEVLVNDAKRHGVVVRPVAVNASEYWSFVEADGALRLGFHLVRGIGDRGRAQLEAAIAEEPFADLLDFARRTQLEREALENLAIAGAFDAWYPARREAMWALRGLDERETRGSLGALMDVDEPAPVLAPIGDRAQTAFDLWATGVCANVQPMAHLRAQFDRLGVIPAVRIATRRAGERLRAGGLVITRQRPGTAKGFVFLTLEDETGLVNVIVRPDVFARYRREIRASTTVIVDGTLQKERGVVNILARSVRAFDSGDLTKHIPARNFH